MNKEKIFYLNKLKALFLTEGVWIRGVLAEDVYGEKVPISSESAVKFCFNGGLCKVSSGKMYYDLYAELVKYSGDITLSYFNDNIAKSVDDIIYVIDTTIAKLERDNRE